MFPEFRLKVTTGRMFTKISKVEMQGDNASHHNLFKNKYLCLL